MGYDCDRPSPYAEGKGLPIYGNKKDLIERYESAETEGNSTEAPAEETVEEVEDDATGSE